MKKILGVLMLGLALQVSPLFAASVEDWSGIAPANTGTYQDSNGSKIEFASDAGPKGGKALKLTGNLASGGYMGVWHTIAADLSKAGAFKFQAKSTAAGDVQMAIVDAFHVQYIAKFPVTTAWSEVTVPFNTFIKDPYYTPPDAIAGHPMDLSKTTNLNFSPQMAGASVVLIGPVESTGSPSASAAPAADNKTAAAPAAAASSGPAITGPVVVYEFGASDSGNGGTFQDSQGSSFKYTLKENPKKKGVSYLVIDYDLKQGGYCGMYHRTGSSWDGQNWNGGKTLSFNLYCKQPLVIGLAIKDKNNNQYVANSSMSKGGNWEKITVNLADFKLDPYYTPPDAIKGAPLDLSAVKSLNIQAQTVGKYTLSIDGVTVNK